MPMARFETGPGGNPHWHLFAMGLAGPRMQRVRGDENGDGDEPPDTGSVDERCVVKALDALNAGAVVRVGLEAVAGLAHRQLTWFVRRVLCGLDGDIRVEAESDEDGNEDAGAESVADSEEIEGSDEAKRRDVRDARAALTARVSCVLDMLVSRGVLEECHGGGRRWRFVASLDDERCVVEALDSLDAEAVVRVGLEAEAGLAHCELSRFVRRALCCLDGDICAEGGSDNDGGEDVEAEGLVQSEEIADANEVNGRAVQDARSALAARATRVLGMLVSRGVLEECRGE